MNNCKHTLEPVQNALVSRTIRFRCNRCNQPVYREHKRAVTFWGPLMSVWGLAVLGFAFISVGYAIFAMGVVGVAMLLAYVIDTKQSDLRIYTAKEKRQDGAKAKQRVYLVAGVLILGVIIHFAKWV